MNTSRCNFKDRYPLSTVLDKLLFGFEENPDPAGGGLPYLKEKSTRLSLAFALSLSPADGGLDATRDRRSEPTLPESSR
jgi:hypothetical protein